jgi:hypothetical protein
MPVFDNGRKNRRQKSDAVDLVWLVEGRRLAGKGRLIDISLTGLCVEVSSTSCPVQAGLTLVLQIPKIPAAPKRARLRWYRRVAQRSSVYLCGLVFLPPCDQAWRDWVAAYIGEQDARAADPTPPSLEDLVALLKHGEQAGLFGSAKAPTKPKRAWGSTLKKV